MKTSLSQILLVILLTLLPTRPAAAEPLQSMMVRLAKIEIHPAQLEAYKAALREEIEASLRLEPGVLALRAVSEKANPARITIMEVYANVEAYKSHLETPHFKKYKDRTQAMVKSLELVDVDPIMLGEK